VTHPPTARVDLHLHSHASNVTDYYAANAFALPESYSKPVDLYRALKRAGMSLVTLTDHNSIDGTKELLDKGYSDVFISAEMTTTFPEDGCNIHITVINMTEAQFRQIDHLRPNVYEMVAYIDREISYEADLPLANKLAYFMTHPLMSTQNRPYGREGALSVAHIEKALLLCNCIEAQNGARTRALNEVTQQMLASLDARGIERLANRHGIPPKGDMPWLKAWVAGSDDHSGINPGQTWTTFDTGGEVATANGLVLAIRKRQTAIGGAHGGPLTIAHSIIKLLYDGGRVSQPQATTAKRPLALSGALQALLGSVFAGESPSFRDKIHLAWRRAAINLPWLQTHKGGDSFEMVLERAIHELIADPRLSQELAKLETPDERIFYVIKSLVYGIFRSYVSDLRTHQAEDLIGTIKRVIALCASNVMVSLPYLLAFTQQSADGLIARDVRKRFGLQDAPRLALLTDTFFEVNGVSGTIRRMLQEAERRGIEMTALVCVEPARYDQVMADTEIMRLVASGRLKLFCSVSHIPMPHYDGLVIHIPPVLDILKFLQEGGFSKVQLSTPGPMGMTGLLAAKLLQIESSATYHTSFPEYVENYTKDVSLEALAWRYMVMFYQAVDEAVVPSHFVAKLLHQRGLRKRKLLILDRWVNVERFRPELRDDARWGVPATPERVVFGYVGRLAVEKNLHLLAKAFRTLCAEGHNIHLALIGDGPYRNALESQLAGELPVTFTGYLAGSELARALASLDVKVFPSTTDTWGNAPLEAQAAGVPVIVTNIGGPAELVLDGITGMVIEGNSVDALLAAMRAMLEPQTRQRMARSARGHAVAGQIDEPFSAILDSEGYRRRERVAKAARDRLSEPVESDPQDWPAKVTPLPVGRGSRGPRLVG
jgi:glycosyltransferase involved in cell wall biosynthesis